MIQYQFLCDEKLVVESAARLRALWFRKKLRGLLKSIAFLGLSALLALCIYERIWALAALFALLVLLLLMGPRADYWIYKRKFRKSPFFNTDFTFHLNDDGYTSQWDGGKSELSWRMFTKARRLSDGFMVYHGSESPHWWPDSALAIGTANDVDALLRKYIADYDAA